MPPPSLADYIRQRREAAGIRNQSELARRLGVRQQQVSKWEKGTALPSPKRIPALASALGVDAGALYVLLAEASQAEAAATRQDRDLLIERLQRFTDRYEELGHTYAASYDLLKVLLEKIEAQTRMMEAMVRQLDRLGARWPPPFDGEDPPSGRPGRRRS